MRTLIKDTIIITPKDSSNVKITLDGAQELDLSKKEVEELRKNPHKLKELARKDIVSV